MVGLPRTSMPLKGVCKAMKIKNCSRYNVNLNHRVCKHEMEDDD